jgi:hypothetical protein
VVPKGVDVGFSKAGDLKVTLQGTLAVNGIFGFFE